MRFFKCEICGKIITMIEEKGVPTICCGQKMEELIPGTSDGAFEKHVPVVNIDGATVKVMVGEVEHPMMEKHYIQWIAIETNYGYQVKYLKPDEKPVASFALADGDELIAAYEFCNIHGLWKK